MNPMRLADIAAIVAGELYGDCPFSVSVSSVGIDTRTLTFDSLFVALKGQRVDGHTLLNQAQQAGAVVALTNYVVAETTLPQIVVQDTAHALGLLGAANRQLFSGNVAAITGSCGKTSVKELLRSIFSLQGKTLATDGNLNNALGVPLTLCRIDATHQYAVVEMGTSSPGEIAYIANLGRPTIATITNAADSHLEELHSVAGVAEEKGAIFDALPDNGIAVLNADDVFCESWRQRVMQQPQRKVCTFSLQDRGADCYASVIVQTEQGMSFMLHAPHYGEAVPVSIAFWGSHQVSNACCAALIALASGVSFVNVVAGLEQARPFLRRGQRFKHCSGATVVDETYNANPQATRAALDALAAQQGERFMVLGDMLELGASAEQSHQAIGDYAREKGIEHFLSFGPYAKLASTAFGNGLHFEDKAALAHWLNNRLIQLDTTPATVVVKGSNGMKMIEIVDALVRSTCEETR